MTELGKPVGEYVSIALVLLKMDGEWAHDQDMVNSISVVGQLDPIVVFKQEDGSYFVSDGRRRASAMKHLGFANIDARIVPADLGMAVATLAGNLHSRNLLSEARAIEQIGDLEQVRRVCGLTKSEAEARLRLLLLIKTYQDMVENGQLSITAAKALAKLPVVAQDVAWQLALNSAGNKKDGSQRRPSAKVVCRAVKEALGDLQPQLAVPVPDVAVERWIDPAVIAMSVRRIAEDDRLTPGEVEFLTDAADVLDKLS